MLAVLLASLLVLAGCTGSAPETDPEAAAAVDRAGAAIGNVTAYSYTIDGSAVVERGDRSERVSISGEGRVNVSARRLVKQVTGSNGDEETIYLDGRQRYRPCPFADAVNVREAWYPTNVSSSRSWRSLTLLGDGDELTDVPARSVGNETVDGVPTHVVVLQPRPSTVEELRREYAPAGRDPPDGDVTEFTLRLWVANGTGLPQRMRVTERRRDDRGTRLRIRQTLEFDYGPTPVTLPNTTVASQDACPEPSE